MNAQSQQAPHASTASPPTTIRCAVVGVGRMGRHHARKYANLAGAELIAVVDADPDRREAAADEFGCLALADEKDLLAHNIHAATIATPTTHHLRCAEPLLRAGISCLIEKPLCQTVEEGEQLVAMAAQSGATLMVGHIERFNPVIRAMQRAASRDAAQPAGINPRFIEVHRVSPMTFRSVDVSVVMDMMIHDLDVVLWLMDGHEPTDIHAAGIAVLTEHEDVCNARLTFETPRGKCVANITASRLAFKTERKMRIIGDNAYVSVDFGNRKGQIVRRTANDVQMHEVREALRQGADLSSLNYHELVSIEDLEVAGEDQLETEISTFLDCIRTRRQPPISGRAGLAAVRTAQRIIDAARADW